MVRTPCCEEMGMKKGPWTPEEDHILVSYIHLYGHENWRALPRQAGLLRCGKSCRLRWINYLRPDIKRGNFTKEEEETITKLHQILGNRWAAIAAKLPGRTDNEIKNFWHTHLKKKLLRNSSPVNLPSTTSHQNKPFSSHEHFGSFFNNPVTINTSSSTTVPVIAHAQEDATWHANKLVAKFHTPKLQVSFSSGSATLMEDHRNSYCDAKKSDEEMEFWYNLFVKSSGDHR